MSYKAPTLQQHLESGDAKRILALDGGGLRGIITLAYLQRIEALLRERHGGKESFRLCHYFDLIAGTSTGAIIAAGLAKGMSVQEISDLYVGLGKSVFKRSWFRRGYFRAKYRSDKLTKLLKSILGASTKIGDQATIKTGLLIVSKRMDTGSPWPIGNNPKSKYYHPKENYRGIANSMFPLWKVVRASTAAPTFFDSEKIVIATKSGKLPEVGDFVDGGISPFNNPALQALMYATLDGYKLNWEMGEKRILLVSVGTGQPDPSKSPSIIAGLNGVNALKSLMDDCSALTETFLQWISRSPTARIIDRDLGDLSKDALSGEPMISYLRYNLPLTEQGMSELNLKTEISPDKLKSMANLDDAESIDDLAQIGEASASKLVKPEHFPDVFDLR